MLSTCDIPKNQRYAELLDITVDKCKVNKISAKPCRKMEIN